MSTKREDAIKRALNRYRQTPTEEFFPLDGDVAILASVVKLPQVKSLERKKALVRKALEACNKSTIDLESFGRALSARAGEFESSENREWHLVFPVNIPPHAWRRRRSFTALDIRFVRVSPRWKRLDLKAWREEVRMRYRRDEIVFGLNFSLLLSIVKSRDASEAFRDAERRYHLLLGAFNTRHTFGRIRLYSGGRPPPLAKLLSAPNFGVFREDGTYECVFYRDDPPEKYEQFRPETADFKNVDRLMRYFKRVEGRSFTGRLDHTRICPVSGRD